MNKGHSIRLNINMKYCWKMLCLFLLFFVLLYGVPVRASLPLQGKVIVVDAGHGGLDPGTTYKDIYEKDINLKISKYLENVLSQDGATVILTRNDDNDLSNGVKSHRKKADFDNRIKIINNEYTDMYLSIHLNYLANSKYYGVQVFYNKENENLAKTIQMYLNSKLKTDREIKEIPKSTYMYKKLEKKGVLIECGFMSNTEERKKLVSEEYQKKLATLIAEAVVNYYR